MFWARTVWFLVLFTGLALLLYGVGYASLVNVGEAPTPQQLALGKALGLSGFVMMCFGTLMTHFYDRVSKRR